MDGSAEITEFFDENGSQLHHVELTVDDLTYSMNNYYISPKTKEISTDFSNCFATSDISFGDLNRTDTSTTKFQQYTNIMESMDFQELLVENTCIPIRGNRPTTCPDSVLSSGKYNEEVDLLSHDTLTSDHIAVKISTDFPFFDEPRSVRTVYYDMESITVEKIAEIWDELTDQPSDVELALVCSKLVLLGRRVSNGTRKKVGGRVETVDEYWAREMANDEKKIGDLKNIFEIEKKINGTADGLTGKKKLSRRENRKHLRDFKKAVSKTARLSHDEHSFFNRIIRKLYSVGGQEKFKFTMDEFKKQLEKLRASAAPGPDRLCKHLLPRSEKNKAKLLWYINDCIFRKRTLPSKLLESTLIFVDKKPISSKKRPICLGSRLIALFDKLMTSRISVLVDRDPRFKNVFGYREDLSIEEFYGCLLGKVAEWENGGFSVGAIQVDVASAFTSVCHKRLIIVFYKFIERSNCEEKSWYIVTYIHMWLGEGSRVIFYEKTSVRMRSGVPQGSALSPVVFVVFLDYISGDIDCIIMKFADDCTLLIRGKTMPKLKAKIEESFKKFTKWLESRKLGCEPSKSKILILHKSKQTLDTYFDKNTDKKVAANWVFMGIPIVELVKILGVTVDSHLNFVQHTNNVCNMFRRRINGLRRLKKLGLGFKFSMQFCLCVRGILNFGLWWICKISAHGLQKMERVWNKLLRTALHEKCPNRLPLSELRELTGTGGIADFVHYLMNLRMVKINDKDFDKCDKFTLDYDEFERVDAEAGGGTEDRRSKRSKVIERTSRLETEISKENLLKSMGHVKTYLYYLGKSRNWQKDDFFLEKLELRVKYEVINYGVSCKISNLSKSNVLDYLVSVSKSFEFVVN